MVALSSDLALLRRDARIALSFVSLVSLLNFFDRVLVTVVAEPIKREFALSDTELGFLTGPALVLIYAISSLIAGRIADQFNRRAAITFALALWSGTTFLCGTVRTFSQMLLFRAGVGIGEGGFNPPVLSLLSDYFSPVRRANAVAIFYGTGMLGVCLSFLIGGYVNARYGWRAVFVVAGVPGLVLAAAMWLFMREPERGRFDGRGKADADNPGSLAVLATNAPYRWLVFAAGVGSFASLGILQWLSIFFIRSHGMSLKSVGVFFGPAMAGGMMVGLLVGGWIGNRLARVSLLRPIVFCACANLAVVPLYWIVLWLPSNEGALGATFAAAAVGTSWGPAYTAAMQNLCGPRVRAMAAAISNLGTGLIAQALLPLTVGILSDHMAAIMGSQALRYALTIVVTANLLAAACFVKAARLAKPVLAPEVTGISDEGARSIPKI